MSTAKHYDDNYADDGMLRCSGQDFLDFRTGDVLTSANACASHRPASARPGTRAPRRGVFWCLA
jgi:hypothetical protein